MEISSVILGQRLKKARKEKRLSQEQVAEEIGLSAFHLGRIERGSKSVYLDKLMQWCDCLDVPLEQIIIGTSVETSTEYGRRFVEITRECSKETIAAMLETCSAMAEIERRAKSE